MKDLLDSIEPYLPEYRNQRRIELGCSPGYVSYLLFRRLPFAPFGVDFSPEAHIYIETMAQHATVYATFFQLDAREFTTSELYDVAMSFGLIEHFSNAGEILEHGYHYPEKPACSSLPYLTSGICGGSTTVFLTDRISQNTIYQ